MEEKDRCIKLILSDKDFVERVKEWISRREDMQQASFAASKYNSMDLNNFLMSLPPDEFDQMKQDLDIERAFAACRIPPSSQTRRPRASMASVQDVPGKLDEDKLDDTDVELGGSSESFTEITEPQMKASGLGIASGRTEDISSASKLFTKFDGKEDEKLKTVQDPATTAPNWKFPQAPDFGKEANQEQIHNNYQVCSSLESFRAEEAESNQTSVENEATPSMTTIRSGSAESNNADDYDLNTGGSSGESHSDSPPSRTSWTDEEEPALDDQARATEHDSYQHREGVHVHQQQAERSSVGNYQHSQNLGHVQPRVLNHGFAGQNFQQLPATGSHSAPQISAAQNLQDLNFPQFNVDNLQNHSQIAPETLHAIVMMLDRELMRRGNQPTRCDSCANLKAENKNLRKSCRCLGQQLELLKWNYILLEEMMKNLEEILKQKENENKENIRVIQYFHEQLVERRNEISNLKKEIEVVRNKFEQERKQLYEKADKEEKKQTQFLEQRKKQTQIMLERVHETLSAEREEKQTLQQELQQKSEESSDLQKENQLLKEENKDLQEKLASSQALVNQLELQIQTLEEEKRQDREANEALQDEYICREAQFNERINSEIKQLMELFENLRIFGQRHGFFCSLDGSNVERENDNDNNPSPPL